MGFAENVQNGEFKAAEGEVFSDKADTAIWNCKYPVGAHKQFPTWGDCEPAHEAALMQREIARIAGRNPLASVLTSLDTPPE